MVCQFSKHRQFKQLVKTLGITICICLAFLMAIKPSLAHQNPQSPPLKWVQITAINGDFETIAGFLKSSIEEEGLTIANEGNVADMLLRTKDAVKGAKFLYKHAIIYQFCSAKLGFELFALSPENIAGCPLNIFAYQLKNTTEQNESTIYVGYRLPPIHINKASTNKQRASAKVFEEIHQLLARIVKRTAE